MNDLQKWKFTMIVYYHTLYLFIKKIIITVLFVLSLLSKMN